MVLTALKCLIWWCCLLAACGVVDPQTYSSRGWRSVPPQSPKSPRYFLPTSCPCPQPWLHCSTVFCFGGSALKWCWGLTQADAVSHWHGPEDVLLGPWALGWGSGEIPGSHSGAQGCICWCWRSNGGQAHARLTALSRVWPPSSTLVSVESGFWII